jgi:hypothetical protein
MEGRVMPVSYCGNISPIMLEVARLNPKSILDCGSGFGKFGLLCRELLDIQAERYEREKWQVNIVGVEGFYPYRNAIHDFAYTAMIYEDFTKRAWADYQLVLLIDSLEHIDKPEGYKFLDGLLERNKHVIVSCPTGVNYLQQGAVHDNEMERHRAHWTPEDFEIRGGKILSLDVCVVASLKGMRANKWIK